MARKTQQTKHLKHLPKKPSKVCWRIPTPGRQIFKLRAVLVWISHLKCKIKSRWRGHRQGPPTNMVPGRFSKYFLIEKLISFCRTCPSAFKMDVMFVCVCVFSHWKMALRHVCIGCSFSVPYPVVKHVFQWGNMFFNGFIPWDRTQHEWYRCL